MCRVSRRGIGWARLPAGRGALPGGAARAAAADSRPAGGEPRSGTARTAGSDAAEGPRPGGGAGRGALARLGHKARLEMSRDAEVARCSVPQQMS